jgi:hypothetical protein
MTCATCQHYKPKESRSMAAVGFALCSHGPRWQFNAPTHSCKKHESASPEVIEARKPWALKGTR